MARTSSRVPITLTMVTLASVALAVGCGNDGGPIDTGDPDALPTIFINEILASNATGLQDETGSYPDWIELYNPGNSAVDLGGYWLTDDVADKVKWQIPAGVSIPAGGYLVFFADGDTAEGDLHTSFSLDRLGEDVALFGPSSLDNPEIDSVEDYDPQATDQSLARMPDGSGTWQLDPTPTPGEANGSTP